MTRLTYFRVNNAMIFSILISNLIGFGITQYLTQRSAFPYLPDIVRLGAQIDKWFLPASLLVSVALILIYERPIRAYLTTRYERKVLPSVSVFKARQRLLNEPFFLIGLSFCMWLAAAVAHSSVLWVHDAGTAVILIAYLRRIETGLITVTVAFFVVEFILQRSVIPYLFPDGGLSAITGTVRIRGPGVVSIGFSHPDFRVHGSWHLVDLPGEQQSDQAVAGDYTRAAQSPARFVRN